MPEASAGVRETPAPVTRRPASEDPAGLTVAPVLRDFVETELLAGLDIAASEFWSGLTRIVRRFTPANRALLDARVVLQDRIDDYYRRHSGEPWDADAYQAFLEEIGYLESPVGPFAIGTGNVDEEVAAICGPQLVVPLDNARFALNAANARWGSLYDALYGTDVVPTTQDSESTAGYDPARGADVIARAAAFLDEAVPLVDARHADVTEYRIATESGDATLDIGLSDGRRTRLVHPDRFVGYANRGSALAVLLCNNGLHIELVIDREHSVGGQNASGVSDICLEAAVSTIQDAEDSVAAVDGEDKVAVYRNWLGLMKGTLSARFTKNGRTQSRRLADDRSYTLRDGTVMTLPGRSLLLMRNVGLHMTTPAVTDDGGAQVFEGILDAVITTACALYDLRRLGRFRNSRAGSIYIVKPKLHGSEEAAFVDGLFAAVEDLFGLDRYTIKVGVMDEERRTSVNLDACVHAVRHRLVFINTGFLDRTGDEIHTSMEAGPMLPREEIKAQAWLDAYERGNVDTGLRCGLGGKAQIGKGMWPKPDAMQEMLATKQSQLEAGASCAWVPSPTAATLHAMHFHRVSVTDVQVSLRDRPSPGVSDLLLPPLAERGAIAPAEVHRELDSCAQSILGYVVRWIDQGIGCSKVPDLDDVGLMEDRATLRISSQLLANWLRHGLCAPEEVIESMRKMALVVDRQNENDPAYESMAPGYDGLAFRTAVDLVLRGRESPNGYTEALLHARRRQKKVERARSSATAATN